jgi:arginyl-tRNA synthetase
MSFVLHDDLKLEIAKVIAKAVTESGLDQLTNLEIAQIYQALTATPDPKFGHIAFACFPLAKLIKGNPAQVASTLLEKLPASDLIQSAITQGPYLNFFIQTTSLAQKLIPTILDNSFFQKKLTANAPKTIIEFSQPNTHKEMHVGHMRNLCLGDALIKLHRYCNYPTISTTFPGDVGTHVAKCLWYYKKHNQEKPPLHRKGAWLGSLYTKANNLLVDQLGSHHEEENRLELTAVLKQLEAKSGEYYDLWVETRKWSVELMQEVYGWANVTFDSWYWESDVDSSSLELVKKYYAQGLFKEDQGAIGIDLSEDKLGFCILIKSDGTGLYATKDLELARRKFEDHQVEKSIYVVDNRQAHHFKQVFKVLEKMGFENAKNCYHLQYEMVELPDGAMSSRKGNIVPIQALIDQMVKKINDDYLHRYQGQWTQEQINHTAHIVASGAIKYGMTRVDSTKKIVFDMNEWLKLDGESGPYIQYVHARINSMLEKLPKPEGANFQNLTTEIETHIILKLAQFNSIVQTSLEQYKTHLLCGYLYELAKLFNSFYAECPVASAEEALRNARYELCAAVKITLKEGLSLLGIEAPTKM